MDNVEIQYVSEAPPSLVPLQLIPRLPGARVVFDIPPQSAAAALIAFGEQANITVLVESSAREIEVPGLTGEHSVEEGLELLLQGTGLVYRISEESIFVSRADAGTTTSSPKPGETSLRKSIFGVVAGALLSAFGTDSASGQDYVDPEQTDDGSAVEEIVVTASRRGAGMSIQDTPMAVSALSQEAIVRRNLVGMDDYLRTLPGVSMHDRGAGQNSIVIRGIASEPQIEDPAVGVYFGETPVTGLGSVSVADTSGSADLKLVDIARVEVLRGPQGTLYGAGSMGGAVRTIPASPDLQDFHGRVAARYSITGERGSDNGMAQAVVNIPLVDDELAVRAVAYKFENSGYVANVASTQSTSLSDEILLGGVPGDRDDVGSDRYTGYRFTVLWAPSDRLDISSMFLQQEIEQHGLPEVGLDLDGEFQQVRLRTGPNGQRDEFLGNDVTIGNVTANYDFGWAALAASSSWVGYDVSSEFDGSVFLNSPMYFHNTGNTEVAIQEVRISSQLDSPLQFLLGIYHEDNDDRTTLDWLWSGNPALDPGPILAFDRLVSTEQLSIFGEVSYDLSENLSATAGVRLFDYERITTSTSNGVANPVQTPSEDGKTYKVSLKYTPSDSVMIYGQWAEGFRFGPVQQVVPDVTCDIDGDGLVDGVGIAVPEIVESDITDNFELGVKARIANGRVVINTAVYRIDWDGIPVLVVPPCFSGFRINAGTSRSEGIEVEVQTRFSENLFVDASASYGEAVLTEDVPFNIAGFGADGDDLPGSSDFNASLGVEYRFDLGGHEAFVRGDYSYVGEYYNNFARTGPASGGFGQVNLKYGMSVGRWYADIYVQNLTNVDDFTWVDSVISSNRVYRLRPRSVGVSIAYEF